MTDLASAKPALEDGRAIHTSAEARRRLTKRYAAERNFRFLGLGAVLLAGLFLVILLYTVVSQGIPAFTYHYATLPLELSGENIDEDDLFQSNFRSVVADAIEAQLPFAEGRNERRTARGVLSSGADILLREKVLEEPELVGATRQIALPVSDTVDLYLKGLIVKPETFAAPGEATPSGTTGNISITTTANGFSAILQKAKQDLEAQAVRLRRDARFRTSAVERQQAQVERLQEAVAEGGAEEREERQRELDGAEADLASLAGQLQRLNEEIAGLEARIAAANAQETLTSAMPSYLVRINGGVVKATAIGTSGMEGRVLVPLQSEAPAPAGEWSIIRLPVPEARRQVSDQEIAYVDHLEAAGLIERQINTIFFTRGASREAEMAGILGAVVGSVFTLLVTLMLAFPLGVASAIYLEEFAPKNRWTDLIEVNINNLAAVPSIVFGLLGLAVFLNFFGLPRSAPVAGGMVLALMTLPTIIIASRAALKAVPPSIREAALGVGASKIQTVFHHVLPLAMPGIMTGTIIGMAQALGETAPLLMIGMVAFIVDIPGGFFDPATVLPVQIFMWADFPEAAFQQKTSAAIMVLLAFLVVMNALAVILRKRFERRW